MTPLYTTFDPAHLGTGLDLSQSNQVISVGTNNTRNQFTRALYGKSKGTWRAEILVWGSASIANATAIGFVNADASPSLYVGGDADGYGYLMAEGELHNAGADIAPSGGLTVAKKGDTVGLELDARDPSTPLARWLLNGNLLAEIALAPGAWYPAVSLAVPSTTDTLMAFINGGQRAFDYPANVRGWYELPVELPAARISSADYLSLPSDSLANAVYEGRIGGGSFAITRGIQFWTDGKSSTKNQAGSLTVLNPDGELDWMVTADVSGLDAYLNLVNPDGSFDAAENVSRMIVKDAVPNDDGTLKLTLEDTLSNLDVPLQNRLIHPDAEEASQNKPWPISIGAVRSMSPVLLNSMNLEYAISDTPVIGLGYVREKGDPWDPNAVPPDYIITDDRQRIIVDDGVAPQGKVTADVSSVGGGTEPTGADDALNGDGNPFVDNGSGQPAGFTIIEDNFGGNPSHVDMPYPGVVRMNSGLTVAGLEQGTFLPGRHYRYNIRFQFTGALGDGQFFGRLFFATYGNYGSTPRWMTVDGGPQWNNVPPKFVGQVPVVETSGIIRGPGPGTFGGPNPPPVGLILESNYTPGASVDIMKLELLLIPDVYEPAALLPASLETALRNILEGNFGMSPTAWSSADARAIDDASGYTGIGWNANEAITVRQALDEILPSYGAACWQDKDNVLRFLRIEKPEDIATSGVLHIYQSEFLNDLTRRPDRAPGLTSRSGYRKNWTILNESDFVTDFIDVPRDVRRALSGTHQGFVASSVQLPQSYSHAVSAEPLDSVLDDRGNAQTEIDRVNAIYADLQPGFYSAELSRDVGLEVGEVVVVHYNRYGLDAGKYLQVRNIVERTLDNTLSVTFWG